MVVSEEELNALRVMGALMFLFSLVAIFAVSYCLKKLTDSSYKSDLLAAINESSGIVGFYEKQWLIKKLFLGSSVTDAVAGQYRKYIYLGRVVHYLYILWLIIFAAIVVPVVS
jgi:hypothetical protein